MDCGYVFGLGEEKRGQPRRGRPRRRVFLFIVLGLLLLSPVFFVVFSGAWNRAYDMCVSFLVWKPRGTAESGMDWTWSPPGFVCRYLGSTGRIVEERRIGVWDLISGRGPQFAGPDCVPVGQSLRILLSGALLSGSIEGEMYATPSRINEGVWLISASINGDVAVWAVDGNPQADPFTGIVAIVNSGARQHSDLRVDIPDSAPAPVALEGTEDPDGIFAAEGCVG